MKFIRFFRDYKQLGGFILLTLISLVLDLSGVDKIAHIILSITALAMVIPMSIDMYRTLQEGRYGVDILAATAIITSVLLGEYWAGIIIVLMLTGGEALEDYAENRAKAELTSLLNKAPQKAIQIINGKQVEVKVSEIQVGAVILVKSGDVIPVDGTITEGETSVDESSITGESLPISKIVDDKVLSGSINNEGTITIIADHTSKDSQYEQIIELVKKASDSQAPFVRLTDAYSIPFTIISFTAAIIMWIITKDANRFLQILVVATPCPLLLAAPIALISGMSRSAKHGIIVKNGGILEKLASIKSIGFDKTGTITSGKPTVSKVTVTGNVDENELISIAAALESQSSHVLAKAVVDTAKSMKLAPKKLLKLKEKSGLGMEGTLKGTVYRIGNLRFMESENISLPSKTIEKIETTASFISAGNNLIGIIEFEDTLRSESASTIKRLRELGIKKTIMVTGDKHAVAEKIATSVGLEEYYAECMPGDKIIAIKNLRKQYSPVGFVGDGVNDAPVLTSSDVGIALGAKGSTAASEAADVVIMLDDISKVAQAREIASRTFSIARQSILIGIGMSFVLMGVFATGKFKPSLGAALQELVDVTVIINALRAHYGSFRKS